MTTCKDCFHYELCKRIDYELEYHNKSIKEAEEELPIKCRFFKNKSDFQEVKQGEWKKYDENIFECSECGYDWYLTNLASHPHDNDAFYCPCCGAKMDGGKSG